VIAAFSLSLRRFKLVNDDLGPRVGDLLLRGVAQRLRSMTTGTDRIARIAGDEFAVVQIFPGKGEAMAFASHVITELQAPFVIDDETVSIGVSVGVALWDEGESDIGRVFMNAGLAMDHAKADGVSGLRLFEPEMDATARERRTMERDIDTAFSLGQFEVHYQPILDIGSRGIIGLEALVRWRHPIRGLVSPGAFIPALEESGLIVPLGQWVLDQACHDAAKWPGNASVAVNVSAVQLRQADFASAVLASLEASGLPPHRLELEITESVLLDEGDTSHQTLHRLQRAGIRISMDDFGTGYSSISYLRRFPFDKIKIDQSFVRDAPRKADALAIVRAIVGLGQSLGIRTLAEGIETEEQLAVIRAEGCNEMQGFLFSPARPADEIATMLGAQRPLTQAA
jgi:diguanylate cyclase (GGDEF)-like protein